MPTNTYDAIIIGAGHNGLVTAAYLARAGYKVLVLERREIVGGCCITEELWPGFKVSTAAYVNSLLRPEIIRDLELKKYGFEMLPRSPSSFTPFPDGRYLMMGPDKEMTHREIAKFSKKDAEAYPKYEDMLTRVADFLEPMLTQTPPDPFGGLGSLWKLAKLGMGFRKLGRTTATEAVEILTGAARTRRRRTPEPPTCCSTTSWASATASAACGATFAAAWGWCRRASRTPRRARALRSARTRTWARFWLRTGAWSVSR
jgi:phytoene dehydrogenase-like protein